MATFDIIIGIIALMGLGLVAGKHIYEKNPEKYSFFDKEKE